MREPACDAGLQAAGWPAIERVGADVIQSEADASGEEIAERGERVRDDTEVGPAASLFAFEQSGVDEDLQVMADGRLAEAERFLEAANARFAIRLSLDEAEQPQPRGVGDHLER